MRRPWLLVVSAGLNVVLAAVLLWPKRPALPAPVEPAEATQAVSSNAVKTRIVVRKQFFTWSEVESPDYRVYIARLREIGCPENTLRDIVVADVNQLYAQKRTAEVPIPEQQWWRSDADTNLLAAASAKNQALEQERRTLLTELLGPNWDSNNPENYVLPLGGPVLGELSPEAKHAVQDILTKAQARQQAYVDAQQKDGKQPDPVQMAQLEVQTRAELSKVLTPPQLEEFLLRYSQSATDLRSQLRGINVTPDEFRNLFRLRDPIYQQLQLTAGTDTGSLARRADLERQLDTIVKNALGPDRYQALRLSQDPAYRDAVALAAQLNAPTNAIPALYRLAQALRQEQDRIRNDPNLTDEQKAAQLKALEDEAKSATNQLLGVAQPESLPTPPVPVPARVHAYNAGETFDQIAAQYGVTTLSVLMANSNLNVNALSPGTPIRIPRSQ